MILSEGACAGPRKKSGSLDFSTDLQQPSNIPKEDILFSIFL
jgi:hypothetical protein